jgi:ubiquitin-protein ligase
LSYKFQRITGYITLGYFNEKLGISPPDISMKNWVYHPWIFQRRIGYITPEYFKEEPGISPPNISMKNRVYHLQIFQ